MTSPPPPPPRRLRIFIVENHDDSRLMMGMALSALGHEVASAATLNEALAAVPQARPEVLISDIGLPDGNGWELLRRLQLPPSVYAVAVSGYGMAADRERSLAAGFRRHLVKPIDMDQLEALVTDAARELAAARR